MKKLSESLLFIFFITIILSWIFVTTHNNEHYNFLPYAVAFIAVVNELCFLNEISDDHAKDKGLISGFVISVTVSILVYFTSIHTINTLWAGVGVVLILIGCILRTWAKIVLGHYFSHTLRVLENHKLINHSIFKFIRHPAYSGTILLMSGFGFLFHLHAGIICFLTFFILAVRRIDIEEEMMNTFFGQQYLDYKKKSWKLFPFII